MDLDSLLNGLENTEQFGHTVTTEEGMILYNSLLILKNENHFCKIYFFGKIFGTEKDYYISFGYVQDALVGKIFYYSTNGLDWGRLPQPTDKGKLLIPLCTTRFQGDPSLVIDVLVEKDDILGGELVKKPQIKKLKEEDRLAATVFLIMEEAAISPRGLIFKRSDGVVVENRGFEGLTTLEAREYISYLHYREPSRKWNTNLLTRDDYNYATDFLDPIDIDVPEGSWIIHLCTGDLIVALKPLYWPGMMFFHHIGHNKQGFIYFGHGKKCLDVPFMINPYTGCV